MTYTVEPVDRAFLPEGRDWMVLERPWGDVVFVIANDAGPVNLTAEMIEAIIYPVSRAVGLPVMLVG